MGGVDKAKNIIAIEGMDGSNGLADMRCSKQPHPQRSGMAYNPAPRLVNNTPLVFARAMRQLYPRNRNVVIPRMGPVHCSEGKLRKKSKHACDHCRAKRIRCTGEKPAVCQDCRKNGLKCRYSDGKRERNRKQLQSLESECAKYKTAILQLNKQLGVVSREVLNSFEKKNCAPCDNGPGGDTDEKLDATMKDVVEETPEELQSMRMDLKQEHQDRGTMRLFAASSSQPQPETSLKGSPYIQPDTPLTPCSPNLPLNPQTFQLRDLTRCPIQPMGVRNLMGTEPFSCGIGYYAPNPNLVFTGFIEGFNA